MAFGDAIMTTAMVRGFHAQGKLAAFGTGKIISWTKYCESVFKNNPNVARPGMERQKNLIWQTHYKRNLRYCTHYDDQQRRYVWNYKFKAVPGEFYFSEEEEIKLEKPFIMIEPNVAWQRPVNVNKNWGENKYQKLAKALIEHGYTVMQCVHENSRIRLDGICHLPTATFRDAVCIMARTSLFIGPEGANHHAAAALDVPAIIVWGDWSPTKVMGYEGQVYFTGGESQACGNINPCPHCREVLDRITVDEIYNAVLDELH